MLMTPPVAPESRPISQEDDTLAAEIGVRLPPNECVISKDQFVEHVSLSLFFFKAGFTVKVVIGLKLSDALSRIVFIFLLHLSPYLEYSGHCYHVMVSQVFSRSPYQRLRVLYMYMTSVE